MVIHRSVLQAMIRHAKEAFPLECCGLLAGSLGRIDRVIRCSNELQSDKAFSIPAVELFSAQRSIREKGKELLGIYHSHPRSEAVPSPRDLAEFHYPRVGCWIISLQGGEAVVRCFKLEGNSFQEVSFITSDAGDETGMLG